MPYKKDTDGLTDLYQEITPASCLHNVICTYMKTHRLTYIALSVPSSRPAFFNAAKAKFCDKFPKEYVNELDSLFSQSAKVLIINRKKRDAKIVEVNSEKTYNEALLSIFVQSVQQINPTSRLLYAMVGLKPRFGLGKFVASETNQCCFKNLVIKLKCSGELRVYVRDHINHKTLLVLNAVSKWLDCKPITAIYT